MIQNYRGNTERVILIGKSGLTINKKEWSDLHMKLAREEEEGSSHGNWRLDFRFSWDQR
jgi:hypothetical protein